MAVSLVMTMLILPVTDWAYFQDTPLSKSVEVAARAGIGHASHAIPNESSVAVPNRPRNGVTGNVVAEKGLRGKYTQAMIEGAVPPTPTGRQAKQIRVSTQTFLKLMIWVLEIVGSALGTCIIFVATAFLQFGYETPPLHNDLTLLKVVGLTLFILMEYALTGYLATTLIARFSMRGRLERFYPYVCAGFYLIHSTIFFVLAGNSPFRTSDLILQVGGACLTFASTLGTNQLISNSNERRRNSEQSGLS